MTLSVITDQSTAVALWVMAKIKHPQYTSKDYVTLGFLQDGKLVAGAVYSDFKTTHCGLECEVSFAMEHTFAVSRRFMEWIFGVPFLHLKVMRLVCYVAHDNERSNHITKRCGYKFEGTLRHRLGIGRHCNVYSMFPWECKWLPQLQNQYRLALPELTEEQWVKEVGTHHKHQTPKQ